MYNDFINIFTIYPDGYKHQFNKNILINVCTAFHTFVALKWISYNRLG